MLWVSEHPEQAGCWHKSNNGTKPLRRQDEVVLIITWLKAWRILGGQRLTIRGKRAQKRAQTRADG